MENIAKFGTRLTAYLLDILLIYIVLSLVVNTKIINPTYDKYMDTYDELNEILNVENVDDISTETLQKVEESYYKINKYGVSYNIATCVIILLYFGVFQKYNNGQTLGKKIMKIKVVSNNDEKVSLGKMILRTLPLQFAYIGCCIPLILSSIMVFALDMTPYFYVYASITSIFGILNLVNLIMVGFRKDKRGIFDLLAGTKVVKE